MFTTITIPEIEIADSFETCSHPEIIDHAMFFLGDGAYYHMRLDRIFIFRRNVVNGESTERNANSVAQAVGKFIESHIAYNLRDSSSH